MYIIVVCVMACEVSVNLLSFLISQSNQSIKSLISCNHMLTRLRSTSLLLFCIYACRELPVLMQVKQDSHAHEIMFVMIFFFSGQFAEIHKAIREAGSHTKSSSSW